MKRFMWHMFVAVLKTVLFLPCMLVSLLLAVVDIANSTDYLPAFCGWFADWLVEEE